MGRDEETRAEEHFIIGHDSSLSMLALWHRKWWIILYSGVGLLLGLILSLLIAPVYRANVTLLPQRDQASGGSFLNQLSGVIGISMQENGSLEDQFGQILHSDQILDSLLSREWHTDRQLEPITLYSALGIDTGSSSRDSLRARSTALKRLRRSIISFRRDKLSGFMEVGVEFPRDPALAKEMANQLANALDDFLVTHHTSRATRQRTFIAARLDTVTNELVEAERQLASFINANRSYQSSPELLRRYQELERRVSAKNVVWVELSRQLEMARIDENRRQVRIDILDSADMPTRPFRPRKLVYCLTGLVIGLLVGLLVALHRKTEPPGTPA